MGSAAAIFGLIGVLLGSASTVLLTVYRERLTTKRDQEARQYQRELDRKDRHDAFQRENLLALQEAVADLIKAVFSEQDRMLNEMRETGKWPAREWATSTATGWVDAEFRLLVYRARVFDETLRNLAGDIRSVAMKSIWASTSHDAMVLDMPLEKWQEDFNELVAKTLLALY